MAFRKLKAEEIDCRVSTVSENGCSLLLYKDARVDQNILDETFGSFGWQRSHQIIDGRLYCTVSVKSPDGEWVSKQDVGTESYTEKEKGQASDSFKRACFNWGIGRELYTAPFIWISKGKVNVYEYNGKWTTRDRFTVGSIGYDRDGNINHLRIRKDGADVYSFDTNEEEKAAEEHYTDVKNKKIDQVKAGAIRNFLIENGVAPDYVWKKYEVKDATELTEYQHMQIIQCIKKIKESYEKEGEPMK